MSGKKAKLARKEHLRRLCSGIGDEYDNYVDEMTANTHNLHLEQARRWTIRQQARARGYNPVESLASIAAFIGGSRL